MEPWNISIHKDIQDNVTISLIGIVPEAVEYLPDLLRKVAGLIDSGDCKVLYPDGTPQRNVVGKLMVNGSIKRLKNYIKEKAVEEKNRVG